MVTYIVLMAEKRFVRGDSKEEIEIESIKIKKAFFSGNFLGVELMNINIIMQLSIKNRNRISMSPGILKNGMLGLRANLIIAYSKMAL
jgi:hypothetical protein